MELIERHTTDSTELIERADGKKDICGYGAVYYDGTEATEYQISERLFERFSPGCFDSAIASGNNIEVRYNHSEYFVLDQTSNSAVIRTDQKGIRYSIPFDSENPDHQKVRAGISKWIKGSSIAAYDPVYRFDVEGGKHVAWVTSVSTIRDVGPVNTPAYKGAAALMRSESLDEQYKAWLETQRRIRKYSV